MGLAADVRPSSVWAGCLSQSSLPIPNGSSRAIHLLAELLSCLLYPAASPSQHRRSSDQPLHVTPESRTESMDIPSPQPLSKYTGGTAQPGAATEGGEDEREGAGTRVCHQEDLTASGDRAKRGSSLRCGLPGGSSQGIARPSSLLQLEGQLVGQPRALSHRYWRPLQSHHPHLTGHLWSAATGPTPQQHDHHTHHPFHR